MAIESKVMSEGATCYCEELAAWVAKHNHHVLPKHNSGLVAFLAVRADVIEAMSAGYPLKTIWLHLQSAGRVSFRYETFLKYVHRHVEDRSTKRPNSVAMKEADGKRRNTTNEPRKAASAGIPAFHYNPRMDEKDLI